MYLRLQRTPGLNAKEWYDKDMADFLWGTLRKFRLDTLKEVASVFESLEPSDIK